MPYEVLLTGRVQGVGCRYYCGKVGRHLGIHGAATNRADGSVLVILQTENMDDAERYAVALRSDEFSLDFYGKIVSAVVRPANHPMRGEYEW